MRWEEIVSEIDFFFFFIEFLFPFVSSSLSRILIKIDINYPCAPFFSRLRRGMRFKSFFFFHYLPSDSEQANRLLLTFQRSRHIFLFSSRPFMEIALVLGDPPSDLVECIPPSRLLLVCQALSPPFPPFSPFSFSTTVLSFVHCSFPSSLPSTGKVFSWFSQVFNVFHEL